MRNFFFELMGEGDVVRVVDASKNISGRSSLDDSEEVKDNDEIGFWLFLVFTVINSVIAITGNGLVIYAGLKYRNESRMRYLDGVVKSLAFTDLFYASFGVLANYFNYYLHEHLDDSPMVKTDDHNEEQTWSIEMLKIVPELFSASTCLHVTFLVLMRYIAINNPTGYKRSFVFKHRRYFIITIWMLSISLCFLPILSKAVTGKTHAYVYDFTSSLRLHGFHTLPVICIVGMYLKLSLKLKKGPTSPQNLDEFSKSFELQKCNKMKKKSSTKIIRKIIIGLLICYLPYIVCSQYVYVVMMRRNPLLVYPSEILYIAISQVLMQLNSCINPFIYAYSIPAFKKIVKDHFKRRFNCRSHECSS